MAPYRQANCHDLLWYHIRTFLYWCPGTMLCQCRKEFKRVLSLWPRLIMIVAGDFRLVCEVILDCSLFDVRGLWMKLQKQSFTSKSKQSSNQEKLGRKNLFKWISCYMMRWLFVVFHSWIWKQALGSVVWSRQLQLGKITSEMEQNFNFQTVLVTEASSCFFTFWCFCFLTCSPLLFPFFPSCCNELRVCACVFARAYRHACDLCCGHRVIHLLRPILFLFCLISLYWLAPTISRADPHCCYES